MEEFLEDIIFEQLSLLEELHEYPQMNIDDCIEDDSQISLEEIMDNSEDKLIRTQL